MRNKEIKSETIKVNVITQEVIKPETIKVEVITVPQKTKEIKAFVKVRGKDEWKTNPKLSN